MRFLLKDMVKLLGLGHTRVLYFCLHTNKRPIVLALSATACEQVAVSPETAMGCRRIRFLQVERDITVPYPLITYNQ